MEKIKLFLLSLLCCVGLASCNVKSYSFYEVNGFETYDIQNVSYSFGPMMSAAFKFEGNFEKYLDVEYKNLGHDDTSAEKYSNVLKNHKFDFRVQYKGVFDTSIFYIYNNKIYTLNHDGDFFVSKKSFSLLDIKLEAEGK